MGNAIRRTGAAFAALALLSVGCSDDAGKIATDDTTQGADTRIPAPVTTGAETAGTPAEANSDGTDADPADHAASASPGRSPIPSAGCGVSDVEPGSYYTERLVVRDVEKKWTMHVPDVHDGESPMPLWIQLHGSGGSGLGQLFELMGSSDEYGFVLIAPTEEDIGRAGWTWREDDAELDASQANPDIAFVDALIDHLDGRLCVDLARVYVAGYSAGGEGASVIGCVLQDRVAAVAPAAAMLDIGDACELQRPVPFVAVHGETDNLAYFDGGYTPRFNEFAVVQQHAQTSIPERVSNVAVRNGCEPEPVVETVDDTWERWSWSCPPSAEVELLVHDGGHSWGPPETTGLIWEFFQQHPMPE